MDRPNLHIPGERTYEQLIEEFGRVPFMPDEEPLEIPVLHKLAHRVNPLNALRRVFHFNWQPKKDSSGLILPNYRDNFSVADAQSLLFEDMAKQETADQ